MSKTREYADATAEYVVRKIPWVKRNWQLLVIAALLVCALFAFWRWQVHASEAARLKSLVEIGATIEDSRARLEALDKRAAEREKQIEAAVDASRRLDKELQDKRDALKRAAAVRVSQIPKDAAGVAKALTDAGFPASAVMK